MFDGWFLRYRVNRAIHSHEKLMRLNRSKSTCMLPIDKSVISQNSKYMEYADRFFLLRGWGLLCSVPFVLVVLVSFSAFVWSGLELYRADARSVPAQEQMVMLIAAAIFLAMSFPLLRITLFRDVFTYTNCPIRFNRAERKIFVFNGDNKGGTLTVPWDDAFIFIGEGRPVGGGAAETTYDLRCHVLDDNEVVRHTFAIGHHCGNSKAEVLQHWEMIRRYMEEGPQALPFPPLALYLSTEPTLRNAFIIQVGGMGDGWLRIIAGVFTVPWALARYVALKTCKEPKWPDWVEAACAVDPDDPYRQPEPRFAGDARTVGPDGDERYFAYVQKAAEQAAAYDESLEIDAKVSA